MKGHKAAPPSGPTLTILNRRRLALQNEQAGQ